MTRQSEVRARRLSGSPLPLQSRAGTGTVNQVPLIGRDAELSVLRHSLSAHGVTTIVGMAGVGKTRLARALLEQHTEGKTGIFVSLAELREGDEVADRIVAAFGITPIGNDDMERCRRRVMSRGEETVLVLDNAEHVLPDVARAVHALSDIPLLTIVVTSREALGLDDESTVRLEPLSARAGAELLKAVCEQHGVPLDDRDAEALSRALDGVPLALKLAAQRATILAPKQIVERLRQSNRVLAQPSDERHGSLNFALNYSWMQLEEDERQLCTLLACFDRGLDIDCACALLPDLDVRSLAKSLWARSWLSEATSSEPRLQMLRTVRAFVLERVSRLDRLVFEDRMVAWAERGRGESRSWWHRRVNEGLATVEIYRTRGEWQRAAEFLTLLVRAGIYSFRAREMYRLATSVFPNLHPSDHAAARTRLAVRISKLSWVHTLGSEASQWSEIAVEGAPTLALRITALAEHSRVLMDEGRRQEGIEAGRLGFSLVKEALSDTQTTAQDAVSWYLDFSAVFSHTHDLEMSRKACMSAYEASEGDALTQARCLNHLAFLEYDLGDFAACRASLRRISELLTHARESERMQTLHVLPALLSIEDGQFEQARAELQNLQRFAEDSRNRALAYYCDRAFAALAMAEGKNARPYLEHAWYELATVDGNTAGIREGAILLALDDIYQGRLAEAAVALQKIIDRQEFHGEPDSCRNMVVAALRYCTKKSKSEASASSDNPFDALIGLALCSESEESFSEQLRNFDRDRLYIPGFFMFRFEDHVRAWVGQKAVRDRQIRLQIQQDGRRIVVGNEVVDLSRRTPLRLMLLCLASGAAEAPGCFIPISEIVAATWPDERMSEAVASNRFYTTLARLRRVASLGQYLQGDARGYCLEASVQVEWVAQLAA